MKASKLEGLNSYYAQMAYIKLMLGLYYAVKHAHDNIESFMKSIDAMSDDEKERSLREALMLVDLEETEILSLVNFCEDVNGVPYSKENMKGMDPTQIREIMFTVCLAISKININFVTKNEKKN